MTLPIVRSDWYSAAELATLALPGLPKAKRKINMLAADGQWAVRVDAQGRALARPRAGRGAGTEYHVELLPPAARRELVRRGLCVDAPELQDVPVIMPADTKARWAWFERQTNKTRAEAAQRMAVLAAVERHEREGLSRSAAIATVAIAEEVSGASIYNWFALVAGAAPHDWLPRLASLRVGGGREAEMNPEAWLIYRSAYLAPEKRTHAFCHRLVVAAMEPRGIAVPAAKTFQRRLDREVPMAVQIAMREGDDASRRQLPPQIRSVAELHALALVNIDGHTWDVFVRFPDGVVRRPVSVAIQDIHSRAFLAIRHGETESAVLTRLAFADLFRKHGVPQGCVLDNGRAFASKWITGGAKTRFRFAVHEDEPLGLLTQLGIENHWAKPYRGQSKPIERGFRDFCQSIAKHPAFHGAYVGNSPTAKPANYGSRAVEWETFVRVVAAGIREHNARRGRRTEMAGGTLSFDEVYRASYATAPIRKATPEQLRMALLAADRCRADRQSGAITLGGNRYWTEALGERAGELMTVRFDPDNLHSEIHVYDAAGHYVCAAPVWEKTGFLDVAAAKRRAKLEADHRRKVRDAIKAEQLLSADQLAALMPDDCEDASMPEARVVRPVRVRGGAAAAPVAETSETANARTDRFAGAMGRLRLVE